MPAMGSIREATNRHPVVVAVVLIAIIAGALYIGVRMSRDRSSGPQKLTDVPYYDEQTGALVMMPPGGIPPLANQSGQFTLVRAHLVPGSKDQVLYLETFTPEGKQAAEQIVQGAPPEARANILSGGMPGRLVRQPGKDMQWVPADSPPGRAIIGQ